MDDMIYMLEKVEQLLSRVHVSLEGIMERLASVQVVSGQGVSPMAHEYCYTENWYGQCEGSQCGGYGEMLVVTLTICCGHHHTGCWVHDQHEARLCC
jgi:hypothetical protein